MQAVAARPAGAKCKGNFLGETKILLRFCVRGRATKGYRSCQGLYRYCMHRRRGRWDKSRSVR